MGSDIRAGAAAILDHTFVQLVPIPDPYMGPIYCRHRTDSDSYLVSFFAYLVVNQQSVQMSKMRAPKGPNPKVIC